MNLIRNCPICQEKISYTSKYSFRNASKNNSRCEQCRIVFTKTKEFRSKCHSTKTKNMVGETIGNLTVLSFSHMHETPNGTKFACWECLCNCGKKHTVRGADLRSKKVQSCGCLQKQRSGKDIHNWSGCGEISKFKWTTIINGAKQRNLEFSITIDYAWNLFLTRNKKCSLSGVDISFKEKTASLDRIDSSKGYIEGNVQWVHKDVNFMKQDFSQQYFITLCNKISNLNPI